MSYKLCIENCPICDGVGFLRVDPDAEVHDANFGKITPCPNRRRAYWDAGLGITLEEAETLDWDAFEVTPGITAMRKALTGTLKRGYGWLYIHGAPGNGKTISVKAACIHAWQTLGYRTRYVRASAMVNWLRASYDAEYGQAEYQARLAELKGVRVLAVDEIGRDRKTEFAVQSLSELMDARYEDAVAGKTVTIWISNHKPEEIFEAYQVDRIRDGRFQVLYVREASRRPAMREMRQPTPWWTD